MDRRNNFDLIRLFAASEVALVHANSHLQLGIGTWPLQILPGVPIFFLISGFLIFQSYNGSRSLADYSLKRVLRIYPALYVCLFVCVFVLLGLGYFSFSLLMTPGFSIWAAAQLTIGQFYNPEFLRAFGSGALNGSLWTISVELQFYVLTPIFAWLFKRYPVLWLPVIAGFALLNVIYAAIPPSESIVYKLAGVTFAPWVYMFLAGAWLSTKPRIVDTIRQIAAWQIALLFAGVTVATFAIGLPVGTNSINPLLFAALVPLILRLAYTMPGLSARLLRGNDVSYGLYIYHMPVINTLMWLGLGASLLWAGVGFVVIVLLAVASWFVVERPALSLRRRRPIGAQSAPPAG